MNGLTSETVFFVTNRTSEEIDKVLVDTPAPTVCGLAVEAVLFLAFCRHQASLQVLFIHTGFHKL
jgi:hypothetical protein